MIASDVHCTLTTKRKKNALQIEYIAYIDIDAVIVSSLQHFGWSCIIISLNWNKEENWWKTKLL